MISLLESHLAETRALLALGRREAPWPSAMGMKRRPRAKIRVVANGDRLQAGQPSQALREMAGRRRRSTVDEQWNHWNAARERGLDLQKSHLSRLRPVFIISVAQLDPVALSHKRPGVVASPCLMALPVSCGEATAEGGVIHLSSRPLPSYSVFVLRIRPPYSPLLARHAANRRFQRIQVQERPRLHWYQRHRLRETQRRCYQDG
jgi:hypothetical protein